MKKLLSILAVASLSFAPVFAGCGKIDTTEGKLKSFDPSTKVAVVETKSGGTKSLQLTPTSKGGDKAEKLVGKDVKVLSSHGKITEIGKA